MRRFNAVWSGVSVTVCCLLGPVWYGMNTALRALVSTMRSANGKRNSEV